MSQLSSEQTLLEMKRDNQVLSQKKLFSWFHCREAQTKSKGIRSGQT